MINEADVEQLFLKLEGGYVIEIEDTLNITEKRNK